MLKDGDIGVNLEAPRAGTAVMRLCKTSLDQVLWVVYKSLSSGVY